MAGEVESAADFCSCRFLLRHACFCTCCLQVWWLFLLFPYHASGRGVLLLSLCSARSTVISATLKTRMLRHCDSIFSLQFCWARGSGFPLSRTHRVSVLTNIPEESSVWGRIGVGWGQESFFCVSSKHCVDSWFSSFS